jgi:hypothetical protein
MDCCDGIRLDGRMKKAAPEKRARRAAAKAKRFALSRAQRLEATQLRRLALNLTDKKARGDRQAAAEIEMHYAESLAFRRVWSSLQAERSKTPAGPRAEKFTGSHKVQGGRVNPR